MSKQIFDQDRPRSTMARLLDEAFAGCDEWTHRATGSAAEHARLQAPRRRARRGSSAALTRCAPRSSRAL